MGKIEVTSYLIPDISERRRLAGEIIPRSADHSRTWKRKSASYHARKAIDLNLETESRTVASGNGAMWVTVELDEIECVKEIVWYGSDGTTSRSWSCSEERCTCEGENCSLFSLTVEVKRTSSDQLPPLPDCRYGDDVKLQRTDDRTSIYIPEIAITGKQGEIIADYTVDYYGDAYRKIVKNN